MTFAAVNTAFAAALPNLTAKAGTLAGTRFTLNKLNRIAEG